MLINFNLKDGGAYMERRFAGLRSVKIQDKDLNKFPWGYRVITFSHKDVKFNIC